jgi:hypothetical protein
MSDDWIILNHKVLGRIAKLNTIIIRYPHLIFPVFSKLRHLTVEYFRMILEVAAPGMFEIAFNFLMLHLNNKLLTEVGSIKGLIHVYFESQIFGECFGYQMLIQV